MEKYIGLVKWFHDQAKDANYGFIQHAILGDLFFHEKSIEKGQNINSFRENEIVVFHSLESKKYKGKIEAINVKLLNNETDLEFLFLHFLSLLKERNNYSDYNIIQKGVHNRISIILESTNDEQIKVQLLSLFINYINSIFASGINQNEESIKSLLKIGKSFFKTNYSQITEIFESKVSEETKHKFWLEGYFKTCQINYVASILLNITELERNKIFQRCVLEEKVNIFFSLLYNIEQIDTQEKLQTTKQVLILSKKYNNENHDKIINGLLNKCPVYFILDLWLENYHESLDFNLFKPYIITLKPENQKKYVKKVLSYIHTGKTKLSVEDFTSLNLMDYETSKLIEQVDKSHFDYSTSIILNVIFELQNHSKIETRKEATQAQYKIYDLILKQIKEPIDILQITGYFDECSGRCSISISNEQKNEDGVIIARDIEYKRNEHLKPRFHPICDGRKAINKETNEPILSEEANVEFWWCANQKCYKPSREIHNSENWEKYTLLDFLTILKINFKYSDLEIYLNIINKANRFLKHLKCRSCNHILYPKGKTQYSFYGVSNFVCKKDSCSEYNKEIYLSHCLNGNCELEIDSRDSVKCKPTDIDADTCGWYVCNNCNSCCSSPQLEKRKWVYDNILHKEYKCHLEGHRDLGIISCNKCGDSMETYSTDIVEFERVLKWFIENKDKSKFIDKSGKNKFNKWWFKLRKGNLTSKQFKERLNRYLQIGFNLPDFDNTIEKDYQLIAEPIIFTHDIGHILICKNCRHTIDLKNDLEKGRAIKTFHKIKFAKETTES